MEGEPQVISNLDISLKETSQNYPTSVNQTETLRDDNTNLVNQENLQTEEGHLVATLPVQESEVESSAVTTMQEVKETSEVRDLVNNVVLQERVFESGLRSYLVKVNPQFAQECYTHDKEWDDDFRTNVAPTYPYTMSPKTTQLIANASTELKKGMSKAGFEINPWKVGPDEEPYVMGVLRRVMVTDTIEPIIGYTDHIADHIKELKEKDPAHIPTIRSFFCGAAVADKCLITRLYELGISTNLVATDIAADSIAVAALNFSVWNELLPENDKYEIHIVKGSVPKELYGKNKAIVLQVEDALSASEEESNLPVKFDALVLDNGLQYVSPEFTSNLISNVLPNLGSEGLYVGALGLDSHIKVEIPKLYHLSQIIKAQIVDLKADYAKRGTDQAPYKYPHKYGFKIDRDSGMILINSVVSDGAARMYTWLGKLLGGNRSRFKEVMAAVKSATELSKANKAVETTPFDYHNVMMSTIVSKGYEVEEIEKPLNYEEFGWTKVGEDRYSNGKEIVDGGTMMRICKEKDPLVLRRTRLLVKKK